MGFSACSVQPYFRQPLEGSALLSFALASFLPCLYVHTCEIKCRENDKVATEARGSFWKMELAAMDHLFN